MAVSFRRVDVGRLRLPVSVPALMMAAGVLGACAEAQPHVHNPAAYDREHVDFAKPPKAMSGVTVCYSKYGAKQADVVRLAAEACGRYGAGIRFAGNTYGVCPLVTPVGAQFTCIGAKGAVTGADVNYPPTSGPVGTDTPGQPGAPMAGFQEGARPMGVLFGRSQPVPAEPDGTR
ncbi:MAG: hypothetical protein COW30_11860 [Rhodospirillales bacterium CG15_BIG_FIL_POST_REV_8_21_14_020_66_15]|nr:MAG: hypothetical protein COW30_11860 [Rhodospirillales bacterium CG15_BIG_FIL_POST_REV_8_21_14_020_66_15]